jgi:hypothetical protein
MTRPGLYASPRLQVLAHVADPARLEAEGYALVTFSSRCGATRAPSPSAAASPRNTG